MTNITMLTHSGKFQKISSTTTVILNFVNSAVKLDFVLQLFDWISLIRPRTRGGVAL